MSLIQLLKFKKLETRLFKMPRLETPYFQMGTRETVATGLLSLVSILRNFKCWIQASFLANPMSLQNLAFSERKCQLNA